MTVASSLQSISDSRSLMISEVRMSSNSCVDCIVHSQLGGHNFLSQDSVSFLSIQFLGIFRQFLSFNSPQLDKTDLQGVMQ